MAAFQGFKVHAGNGFISGGPHRKEFTVSFSSRYHLDCLTPPLREVPEGDWYCEACKPIVQAQYVDDIIMISSGDSESQEDRGEEEDRDYRPNNSLQRFELSLSSSELDVTGSDFDNDDNDNGSASGSEVSLKLDSEPDSELESESESSSTVVAGSANQTRNAPPSSPSPSPSSSEDSIIEIVEVSKPKKKPKRTLTFDPLLPSNHQTPTFSRDPLLSRGKKAVFRSSGKVLSGTSHSLDPLQSSHSHYQRLQKLEADREAEEFVDIESTDSEVVPKGRSRVHSNLDFTSPSTSDASCIDVFGRQRRRRQNVLFSDEESASEEGEFGVGGGRKGKSPISSGRGKVVRRKGLKSRTGTESSDALQSLCNDNLIPPSHTLSSSRSLPGLTSPLGWASGDVGGGERSPNHTASDSSPLRLPNGLKWPVEDEVTRFEEPMGIDGKGRQQQQQQQQQQRKRKRRRRRRKPVRTANTTAATGVKKRRVTRKRRRNEVGNLLLAAQSLSASGRHSALARTAATHTFMRNVMREAVRESYRHDNLLEGLEWARAVLARSHSTVAAPTTPGRSEFVSNLSTPTSSGYVVRGGRKQATTATASSTNNDERCNHGTTPTPADRLYGFTPSRSRHMLCPSQVSSGATATTTKGATPLFLSGKGCVTAKDRRISAEVQRRLPTKRRRRNLSQVLVTPVKLGGLVRSSPKSFDKQMIRDYLQKLDWNKTPPAPILPAEISQKTAKK